jgi:hypothetical protein
MNLAVQDFLFGDTNVDEIDSEEESQVSKSRRGRKLETAWHAWKNIAIDNFSQKYFSELKDDYLTPEDWIFLGDTAKFLKPFQWQPRGIMRRSIAFCG